MRVSKIGIKNFRCLTDFELTLDETTVLIGPNNVGKTAVLDAVRVALSRRWGRRGTGFTEYDVHLEKATSDPKKSPGIEVKLVIDESLQDSWPQEIHDALASVKQIDPVSGKGRIVLQMTCAYVPASKSYEPSWQFIGADGKPLSNRGRSINLNSDFFNYLPVFYLGALRDVADEFSSRSQFWSKLLRSMKIPDELESDVQKAIEELNEKLVKADARLAEVAKTISSLQDTVTATADASLQIRPMPSNSWDVLSKSEIHMRNSAGAPWLPLDQQGQGAQSLSVLFLFDAFVQQLLPTEFKKESNPVLALEEPEAHLHPQAARYLWQQIDLMSGQKIITSHSPYFVQQVPIKSLRLLRVSSGKVVATSIPSTVSMEIDDSPTIQGACTSTNGAATFVDGRLTAHKTLDEDSTRRLIKAYTTPATMKDCHEKVRGLQQLSIALLTDEEIISLETCARRIRGEIFFAKKWLLCEGQSDYLILHALASATGYDFDRNGVAVIDCKNNGSPAHFVKLATAVQMPWMAFVDNDAGGKSILDSIAGTGLNSAVLKTLCCQTVRMRLEEEIVGSALKATLEQIASKLGAKGIARNEPALVAFLIANKTAYSAALAEILLGQPDLAAGAPGTLLKLVKAIEKL